MRLRPPSGLLLAGLFVEAGLGAGALLLAAIFSVASVAELRFDGALVLPGVAAALPLLIGFRATLHSAWRPFARIREEVLAALGPLLSASSSLELLLLAALAGLGEELLFRGVVQEIVGRAAGGAFGVVGSAVAFGLVHFLTPTYAMLAALVGLYFGWLVVTTGSLVPAVVAHGLYDFVALLWMRRLTALGEG